MLVGRCLTSYVVCEPALPALTSLKFAPGLPEGADDWRPRRRENQFLVPGSSVIMAPKDSTVAIDYSALDRGADLICT
jgi:hypothetical protein